MKTGAGYAVELTPAVRASEAELVEMLEALPLHRPKRIARYGWAIPNRLYGAYIKPDGDVA